MFLRPALLTHMGRFLRSKEQGASSTEYALLLSVLALVITGLVTLFGHSMQTALLEVASSVGMF